MKKKLIGVLAIMLACLLSVSAFACNEPPKKQGERVETYNYDSGIDKTSTPFKIVDDGVAKYKIVVPQNAPMIVEKVASELKGFISQISGASLEIVIDNPSVTDKFISLGNTDKLSAQSLSGAGIKDDGYVIKTIDGNVYIYGSQDMGVQNGVYTFLERFTGIRWLTDKDTYIPKSKTVTVYSCDIKEEPIFTFRNWYCGATRFDADFFNHKLFNEGGESWYSPVDSKHNISDYDDRKGIGYLNKYDVVDKVTGEWLPNVEKTDDNAYLVDIHPEYFTNESGIDIDGTTKPAKPTTGYDVCYTSGILDDGSIREGDSGVDYIIKKLKRVLKEDATERKYQYFHIGQMDSRGAICQCKTCQRRIAEINYSGVLVMFINAIEKHINEWLTQEQGRTVIFSTFAYHESEDPPVSVDETTGEYSALSPLCEVSDNVWIRIAPIDADYTYGFQDERQTEFYQNIFEGWTTVAKNFIIWDYNICFFRYYWYYPNLAYLKSNYEYYAQIGVRQLFHESNGSKQMMHYQDALRSYIASKLCWNLNWSVEELRDEFLRLYYKDAYATAKQFMDAYENYFAVLANENSVDIKVSQANTIYLKPDLYTEGFLSGQIDLLDKGINEIIQSEDITEANKQDIILKLKELKVTPMTMIYENYDSYYHTSGYEEFALDYIQIIHEDLGLIKMGYTTVEDLRKKHGLA